MIENQKDTLALLRKHILEMRTIADNHAHEARIAQIKSETISREASRLESIMDAIEKSFCDVAPPQI
jgi:hypothetical protein